MKLQGLWCDHSFRLPKHLILILNLVYYRDKIKLREG